MFAVLKEFFPMGVSNSSPIVASDVNKQLVRAIDDFTSPAVLVSFDVYAPTILYTNKLHKKLTGYSTEELVGKTPKIFQGDLVSQEVKDDMRRELLECGFWNGFVHNKKKNGEVIYIQLTVFSISHNGKKYFVAIKRKPN